MKLIALTGLHGAGKDTVADALPARKLAFADVLYREVAEAYDCGVDELKDRATKETPRKWLTGIDCGDDGFCDYLDLSGIWESDADVCKPCSPRQILQWWGDYRRAQDLDYFVTKATEMVDLLRRNGHAVVITDCRFPNEARMVRQLGGQIWRVVRPGHEPPRTGHASETTGDEFAPDVVLRNAGSLEELRATALKEWSRG